MTDRDDIDSLLQRLRELQLEQQTVIDAIEERLIEQQAKVRKNKDDNNHNPFPLTAKNYVHSTQAHREFDRRFPVGARIRITNKINNRFGRPTNDKDRTGTVVSTDLTTDRVYIITDNGHRTFRVSKNVVVEKSL